MKSRAKTELRHHFVLKFNPQRYITNDALNSTSYDYFAKNLNDRLVAR